MGGCSKFNVDGKFVVLAGASRGLGKEMALKFAAKGANILLLSRSQSSLDLAVQEVLAVRKHTKQTVCSQAVDLAVHSQMWKTCGILPDILICTAGGSSTQVGFLADITAESVTSCLEMNYYSAVFIVQSCLRLWLKAPKSPDTRHIVLTSSTACFVGLPGYIAYTPTKVAVRALADTLRQELLLYGEDTYKVHCTFPGSFISDSLLEEQAIKPELLKLMEKTNAPEGELRKRIMSAETVATRIIRGLEAGQTYITVDFEGEMLLNNMRGPSPRHFAIYDFFVGLIAGIAWWWVRLDFDRMTRKYGREHYTISRRA